MRMPRFEYLKPDSLEEYLQSLKEFGAEARILSGGTGLPVNMKHGLICPGKVVSIKSIPELCSVTKDSEGNVRIGASGTLSNLVKYPFISKQIPALRDAAICVGSMNIRNMVSIGGNVCHAIKKK